MSWIDVHTHLNMLEIGVDEALSAAATENVNHMITIGTCPDDLPTVLKLARAHFPKVACTLGIHPHEAQLFTPEIERFIRAEGVRPEVVAIGETGLDYYRNEAPVDVQEHAFRSQLQIARDLGLPVEIHTRDAEADTLRILRDFAGERRGLLHCFTGTWELAKGGLDLGYDISISGVVTFKNAQSLRDVVEKVPLDRLHIETDAPYLAPVPLRGRKNQPAFVTHTAALVASIKGVTLDTLATQLRANAQALFTKLQLH